MMMSKAELHTPMTQDANTLYTQIDAAIWLLSKNQELTHVNVILHPLFPEVITPMWMIKKIVHLISGDNYFTRLQHKGRKFKFGRKPKDPNAQTSLFSKVIFGEEVTIQTPGGSISIRKSVRKKTFSLRYFSPKFFFQTRREFSNLFEKTVFQPRKLLEFKVNSTQIGDLIASHALRSDQKAGGSLSRCNQVWRIFYRALVISDYISKNFPTVVPAHTYVVNTEPTYLNAIYTRILLKKGAISMDRFDPLHKFRLIDLKNAEKNIKIAHQRYTKKISDQFKLDQAKAYLNARVTDASSQLAYMIHGKNDPDTKVILEDNNIFNFSPNKTDVVIFLHSLSDGQFSYGVDCFDDMADWGMFTIRQLLGNPSVGSVLIKSHPNSPHEKLTADSLFKKEVFKRYGKSGRCLFLKSNVPPRAFDRAPNVVGITRHGSVAEEFAFLGIPIIGCQFARWGDLYHFVFTWKDRQEYTSLLKNISNLKSEWDFEFASNELMSFVIDYRLNAHSKFLGSPWQLALEAAGRIDDAKHSVENYPKGEQFLQHLKTDSEEFPLLVNLLHRQNAGP